MGGWHLAHRATDKNNYTAIASMIDLPKTCICINDSGQYDNYDGVFPEFIHGFYVDGIGIDIGIIYRRNMNNQNVFKIFHFGDNKLCEHIAPANETEYDELKRTLKGASFNDTVTLSTYLNNNEIIAEVFKDNHSIAKHVVKLTDYGKNKFKNGAKINREILMASNRTNYLECGAKFSTMKMYRSTLTKSDGNDDDKYEILSSSNSTVLHKADEEFEMYYNNLHIIQYIDELINGYKCTFKEQSDYGNYIEDIASCDFTPYY